VSDTDSVLGGATAWACCLVAIPPPSPTMPPLGLSGPGQCHCPSQAMPPPRLSGPGQCHRLGSSNTLVGP
ncbi:unnamed protein product, partial [Musa textilis]